MLLNHRCYRPYRDLAWRVLTSRLFEQSCGKGAHTGSSAWKKKCRRFAVGRRKDFEGSIREAFETLKLYDAATRDAPSDSHTAPPPCDLNPECTLSIRCACASLRCACVRALRRYRCETASAHYDVYWGEQWLQTSDFTKESIRPNALVFSIPGFRSSFGEKKAFARLHENCLRAQREQREEEAAEDDDDDDEEEEEDSNHAKAGKQARAQEGRAKEGREGEEKGDGTDDSTSHGPLFCAWTKRGFSIERSGDTIDGPISSFRSHALAIGRSTGGDR